MAEAIQSSNAEIIQICNLSPRKGQANTLRASDFPKVIDRHISPDKPQQPNNRTVDTIIVNAPTQSGAKPQIEVDNALNDTVDRVLLKEVADPKNPGTARPSQTGRRCGQLLNLDHH